MNRSALLAAILERQNLLQERWDTFYRTHGLGAFAFLPEVYQTASSPNMIVWEYWTADQIDRYLRSEGGLSEVGRRWFTAHAWGVQRGFAAVIISNDGDPATEDAHFYRIGGDLSDDTQRARDGDLRAFQRTETNLQGLDRRAGLRRPGLSAWGL